MIRDTVQRGERWKSSLEVGKARSELRISFRVGGLRDADCGPDLTGQAKVCSPDLCCASGESVEDTQTCFLGNELPRERPGPAGALLGVRRSKGPRAGAGEGGGGVGEEIRAHEDLELQLRFWM